ncbi:MAG: FlgO family outer membrane protein [Elusimicrobiota bacterium]|jgi:hypothetical protein
MKTIKAFALAFPLTFILAASAAAQPLEKLAKQLQDGVKDQPIKQAAVLSFPYHDGAYSSGSTIIQERLTTVLVQGGKFSVVERNLLKKALEEMKLDQSGVIDSASTKELGKLLGADAVVLGTLNDLAPDQTEINARIIQTETGKILAAASAKIERTWTDDPVKNPSTGPVPPKPNPPGGPDQYLGKALVQVAILLDTSNSMDGLISQAKNQLWHIINEFGAAERGGNSPTVQVALYEYGNDSLKPAAGYIRQVLPFTSDLDKVSEQLFGLKTNGGQEYCGWAVRDAAQGLQWDKHLDVYKTIFIAGNEPFTQGPVDFRQAMAEAAAKGILVNTIFCGGKQEGMAMQWKAGADAGSGDYANIDQAAQVASVTAPQDAEIQRLSSELNSTFIAYGVRGRSAQARQEAVDKSANASAAGVATMRAMAKASKQYMAESSWDVVTAMESGQLKKGDIKAEELPAEMQKMSPAERQAYIEKKAAERKQLQTKIHQLSEERRKYVAQKEKDLAAAPNAGSQTLGQAMIKSIRSQASKKGFKFKD